jgi:hypothetical protein
MISNGKVEPGNQMTLCQLEKEEGVGEELVINIKAKVPVCWNWVLWSTKYGSTILRMMHG